MIHPRGALLATSALLAAACSATGTGTVAISSAAPTIAGTHAPATPTPLPLSKASNPPSAIPTATPSGFQPTAVPASPQVVGPNNPTFLPASGFASPPPPSANGVVSDSGIAFNGASVLVAVVDAKGVVAGARVAIYGTTLGASTANESGKARLGPLAPASGYRVVVSAPGHVPGAMPNLTLAKGENVSYTVTLRAATRVTGKITNGSYAVVSSGDATTIADAQGAFTLDGLDPDGGEQALTISRPHYAVKVVSVTPTAAPMTLPDTTLAPAPASAYLSFDGLDAAGFRGVATRLAALGWQPASAPVAGGLWVVFGPKTAPDAATVSEMADFAHAGGKLVIVGEWGGYAGYQPLAANAIAHAVGLHLNPDLVRDPSSHPEWLSVKTWGAAGGTARCYSAASTFGLAPMAGLAMSATSSYRVQAFTGAAGQAIVTGGPWGAGKAVVVGDASMWADEDTDGNGTPNLQEGDNGAFWDQIAEW